MRIAVVTRRLVLAFLLVFAAAPAMAQDGKRIALSFDDIPRHAGGFMTPDQRTIALIAGLHEAGVEQAAFFVTTGNLDDDYGRGGEERIRAYVAAGHVIGIFTRAIGPASGVLVSTRIRSERPFSRALLPIPIR